MIGFYASSVLPLWADALPDELREPAARERMVEALLPHLAFPCGVPASECVRAPLPLSRPSARGVCVRALPRRLPRLEGPDVKKGGRLRLRVAAERGRVGQDRVWPAVGHACWLGAFARVCGNRLASPQSHDRYVHPRPVLARCWPYLDDRQATPVPLATVSPGADARA